MVELLQCEVHTRIIPDPLPVRADLIPTLHTNQSNFSILLTLQHIISTLAQANVFESLYWCNSVPCSYKLNFTCLKTSLHNIIPLYIPLTSHRITVLQHNNG